MYYLLLFHWHFFSLPDWSKEMMAPNSSLINFIQNSFGYLVKTKDMQRLKSGFLIKEMLDRFTEKADSKLKPDRSLWLYSAHDLTIIYFLKSIDSHFVWTFYRVFIDHFLNFLLIILFLATRSTICIMYFL